MFKLIRRWITYIISNNENKLIIDETKSLINELIDLLYNDNYSNATIQSQLSHYNYLLIISVDDMIRDASVSVISRIFASLIPDVKNIIDVKFTNKIVNIARLFSNANNLLIRYDSGRYSINISFDYMIPWYKRRIFNKNIFNNLRRNLS